MPQGKTLAHELALLPINYQAQGRTFAETVAAIEIKLEPLVKALEAAAQELEGCAKTMLENADKVGFPAGDAIKTRGEIWKELAIQARAALAAAGKGD